MKSRIRNARDLRVGPKFHSSTTVAFSALLILLTSALSSLGDGCFVFRWNKAVDINEPTQKAIIVYDQGREDLLLQVKYEGSLEGFGWLIPVPSLPVVEKGSMEPFYELSQLTQREFGGMFRGASLGGTGAEAERVKVTEVKTVGAYEVAILSAKDAGSLAHWLESNGYSVPQAGSATVDEYIRKGWYFVAARIQLNGDVAFRLVSNSGPKGGQVQTPARQALQKQMSSGELHPLRISFDTPCCIFPLKISAIGGKPSEVSLFVLSAEPLLNKYIFDKRVAKLREERIESDTKAEQRKQNARICMRNARRLQLSVLMYKLEQPPEKGVRRTLDWSLDDLDVMAAEGEEPAFAAAGEEGYYPPPTELLRTIQIPAEKLTQCIKVIDRLKGRVWHLTKEVYTFRPQEMEDLEFQPAIPVITELLPVPEGRTAAGLFYYCGPSAVPVVLAACKSTCATERINASSVLQSLNDKRLVEPLLALLKDPVPDVRLNAVMATAANWDPRFNDPLFGLLRDPHPRVRWQAAQWLTLHESKDQTPRYLELLSDRDPDVVARALQVLAKINPDAVPRTDLLRLLGVPRMNVVSQSLNLLQGGQSVLEIRPTTAPGTAGGSPWQKDLSSLEAAPLTTNQLTLARLAGLKILYRNGDADAINLALPLLRDTNSIVRNRAFGLLRAKTDQDFPQDDPAKWEAWWNANKSNFKPH